MNTELPNLRYDHVYAIVRIDKAPSSLAALDRDSIAVNKIVQSKEEAEREVQRLNSLNADKGCEYFYQLTRLERELTNQEQPTLPSTENHR